MNFEITNELIDTIKPYTENVTVKISTDNKDWKGRDYKSDFVTFDEKNNVGFEVFDNEIIVFYLTTIIILKIIHLNWKRVKMIT